MKRPWDDSDDGLTPERTDEELINEARRHAELLQQRRELQEREPLSALDLERELEFMDGLERAWADGSLAGLTTAMDYCQTNRRPYPDWVTEALRTILDMPEDERRMQLASMRKRDRQNEIDRLRYDTVRALKAKMTWKDAYAEASRLYRGTFAQGSDSAMRDSYLKFNRAIRSSDAAS